MSENIFKLYTTQFATNLELKLQQMGSMLRDKVSTGFHVGKMASPINQLGAIQLKTRADRFGPKVRTDADFTRRWVFPTDGEIDQLIDSFDELKTIVDPKSQYVTNAAKAVGRGFDDSIIAAAFGTAQTGVDAGSLSSETWASFSAAYEIADTFGASATAGLTVAKMIEAKRILRKNHVDLESDGATWVTNSTGESDLLSQVQFVSTEYNDRPVLVDGQVKRFMGFDIVVMERLPSASNIRSNLVFVKSGMYLGMWKDTTNRVSIRNDLSGEPYDLYTAVSFGATRTQPGKVLKVLCSDPAAAADITP